VTIKFQITGRATSNQGIGGRAVSSWDQRTATRISCSSAAAEMGRSPAPQVFAFQFPPLPVDANPVQFGDHHDRAVFQMRDDGPPRRGRQGL